MKNKFRIGIVICLVILLSGFPQILTQQASGILEWTGRFKGGDFIGEAAVLDVYDGEYQGDIRAYAYHKVVVVSYALGFVTCRAPYLLHTEETHGLPVEFRLKLVFPEFPREVTKIVPIYGSYQTKTGALRVTYSLLPSRIVQEVDIHTTGELFINGEAYDSSSASREVVIIRTLFGFLERILEWLDVPVCFLGGTSIAMADGTYKDIENIEVGDMVLSYDANTGSLSTSMVTEVFSHAPEEMSDFYVVINDEIRVTPNHMLLINDILTPAGCAEVGDSLIKFDGSEVLIESVEQIYERAATYNFLLDDDTKMYLVNDEYPAFPLKITTVITSSDVPIEFEGESEQSQSQQSESQQSQGSQGGSG